MVEVFLAVLFLCALHFYFLFLSLCVYGCSCLLPSSSPSSLRKQFGRRSVFDFNIFWLCNQCERCTGVSAKSMQKRWAERKQHAKRPKRIRQIYGVWTQYTPTRNNQLWKVHREKNEKERKWDNNNDRLKLAEAHTHRQKDRKKERKIKRSTHPIKDTWANWKTEKRKRAKAVGDKNDKCEWWINTNQ